MTIDLNKARSSALIGTLACISVLVYLNTLSNGFVLDDHVAITDNYLVKRGLPGIPELLTTNYLFGWSDIGNTYRPLSLVLFSILYQLFGPTPLPFHVLNVFIFATDVVLLYLFLNNLFDGKKTVAAFMASVLFSLHPIHTEVVANIKGCDELLCFLFAFLCLNILVRFASRGKFYILISGCVCFLLSLLSKETAIALAGLIPFVFFFYKNENKARSVAITFGAFIVTATYLIIRYVVLTRHHPIDNHIDAIENALAKDGLPYGTRFATATWVLGCYLRLLLIPYPLICDYSFNSIPYVGLANPGFIITAAAYLLVLVFAVLRLKRHSKDPYAFGIIFFLATMLLFSNLILLIGATMGERFLFLSSVGFCFIIATLIERLVGVNNKGLKVILRTKTVWLAPIFLLLCVSYSFVTVSRNANWVDNRTLYTHDQRICPDNARLSYYVADDILSPAYSGKEENELQGDPRERARAALPYLYQAILVYPQYALAENDFGMAYLHLGELDSSEVHYKQAYRYSPRSIPIVKALAYVCYLNKDYFQSALLNKRLLELSQPDLGVYLDIGYCYLSAGQYDSMLKYLRKGLVLFPKENVLNKNIAFTFMKIGNQDSASKYEAIARKMEPEFRLGSSAK